MAGEYPRPCSISWSRLPTTSTAASHSPYRSPPPSPPTISMPDRYRVPRTRFSVWRGNTPALARSPDPSFPPPQRPLPTHPTGHHHTPHQQFRCQIDTECGAQGFWFGRGIPPPLLDLPVPASYHLNNRFYLTLQITTALPANHFHARSIPRALHTVFGLAGEYPRPCSISRSQLPTTSTTTSTSPYRLPPHSPPTISMPDRYRVPCTRFSVWQGNNPAPARFPGPSFLPPQRPLLPHHTGHHHTPRQPFQCQIDTECGALGFRFGGGIPPPLLDLLIPASYHLNNHFYLTLQVTTTLPANHFYARLILRAPQSFFGLAADLFIVLISVVTILHIILTAPPYIPCTPHMPISSKHRCQ